MNLPGANSLFARFAFPMPAFLQPEIWNALGSLLAGTGALFALIGSLMMAHTYFSTGLWKFVRQSPKYIFWAILRRRADLEVVVILAKANEERQLDTLFGLCQLIFGFFLQLLGIWCLYLGTLPGANARD